MLLNDGDGRFEIRELPRAAQMAPAYGVVLSDFDADGMTDAVIGQNFFAAQPETGWLDGGLSVLLRGDGKGGFEAVEPTRSGIVIRSDVTSVTCADLNRDARPELVFTTNGGGAFIFSEPGAAKATNRTFALRLAGRPGNPSAIGARVRIEIGDISQTAEVSAGSGYLGQSEPVLWFGIGQAEAGQEVAIEVTWPDGEVSNHRLKASLARTTIRQI